MVVKRTGMGKRLWFFFAMVSTSVLYVFRSFDIYNEAFIFLISVQYGYFSFWNHLGLCTMQEPSYLNKIVLVSIMFHDGIDPNNISGIQISIDLDVLIKHQYLIHNTTLISMGRFFDIIIDVGCQYHTFTYTLPPTLVHTNEGILCSHDIVIFQWWALYLVLLEFMTCEIGHNNRAEGTQTLLSFMFPRRF